MFQTPYSYPNPFQTYQQPIQQNIPQTQQIIKVNGRNGANAYQMPPNSSVLLLDESSPIIWLAQTDGAGYKTVTAYDIQLHQDLPPVDTHDLEKRISKIEEMLKNEPNTSSVKQWKPNYESIKSSSTNGTNNQVSK